MGDLATAVKSDIDELYKRLHLLRDSRDVVKNKLYEIEREIVGIEAQIANKCQWMMQNEQEQRP